jgi:cysteine desulfurase
MVKQSLIYLDNNATTKVDEAVEAAMREWQSTNYGNPSSLHFFGQEAAKAVAAARQQLATAINCDPKEIFFTASGSEGDNLCIKGYSEANRDKGNHIITSVVEHPAVLNSCRHLEEQGFEVTYLPVDDLGFVSPDDLERAIRPDTILVSIMHANNEVGTVQDIKRFVEICDRHSIPFHTDAVQSFLKVPFDVAELGVAMATFSGHKVHAPKGVGFIYKRKDITVRRQIDGGGQEHNYRAGTENVPYIIGIGKAIELFSEADIEHMKNLQAMLITELLGMEGVRLNGPEDLTKRVCNNINISVKHIEGEFLLNKLSDAGICVSTGSACSSKSTKLSPVLVALQCPAEFIHGNVRVSISKYTTEDEINQFLHVFRGTVLGESGALREV